MTDSSYVWRTEYEQRAARGHDGNGATLEWERLVEPVAAYSLHTTATDLARFLIEVLRGAVADGDHLGAPFYTEMLRPHVRVNDSAPWHADWPKPDVVERNDVWWALGWGLEDVGPDPAFWHWGEGSGFASLMVASPRERKGMVMMTNGERGTELYAPVARELVGGGHPALSWLSGFLHGPTA